MNERQLAPEFYQRFIEELVFVQVPPARIDMFNKILEGYDNLAMVSTVDAAEGVLACWVTPDTRPVFLKLIDKMWLGHNLRPKIIEPPF